MAFQHPSAPPRAASRLTAGTPRSGVVHVNVRHADHYTVVGNHLAQHRVLSLVALGLALHIQSLPAGAGVGVKRLCERFPEGEVRIAAGLREPEAHGYLERSRVRLPSGRVVTRTVSYNRPRTVPAVPAVPTTPSTAPPDPSPAAPGSAPGPVGPGVAGCRGRTRTRTRTRSRTRTRGPGTRRPGRARAAGPAGRPPDPFQTCDGCERAFRAPAPGRCRDGPAGPERSAA
ncbi:hypothetical protein GCM10010371_12210 [Streptomyces subrutilus]|uniref:Helix-turn-helix domain-containing protein n=1 Tax=Streptomyces subrutilus TaxID=36818 RepID=A0A5P2URN4_9ACTN|nr:helix-turn-helix domain-containing protein [Streptomyces subrutilus]QEU79387.1 helix-turn-helix domain-containing protein [Streptomyces subrutilus]GGZ54189.1 hypothetical protein GCM10010371_12210 [Streptomyces subrutilus]